MVAILGLIPPGLTFFYGLTEHGYGRFAVALLGIPSSVVTSGVIGLAYGSIVLSGRLRAGQFVKKRPLGWICAGAGALSAFLGMLVVAVLLFSSPR